MTIPGTYTSKRTGISTIPLKTLFTRDLKVGSIGTDVMQSQKYLVAQNVGTAAQKLSKNGFTTRFGSLTKAALVEYQKAKGIIPASGILGPKTREVIQGK
mgnify:CR=1 FL=1